MQDVENDESFVLSDEESLSSLSESSSEYELSSDSQDLDYQGPRRGPVIYYTLTYSESATDDRRRRGKSSPARPRNKKRRKQVSQEKSTLRLTRSYLNHMKLGVEAVKTEDFTNALHFFERALAIAEEVGTIDKETVLSKIASVHNMQHPHQQHEPPYQDFSPPNDAYVAPAHISSPLTPAAQPPPRPQASAFALARTAEQIFEDEKRPQLVQQLLKNGQQIDRVSPESWRKLVHSKYKKLAQDKKDHYEDQAKREAYAK